MTYVTNTEQHYRERQNLLNFLLKQSLLKQKKVCVWAEVKSRLFILSAFQLMNSSSRPSRFCFCLDCFEFYSLLSSSWRSIQSLAILFRMLGSTGIVASMSKEKIKRMHQNLLTNMLANSLCSIFRGGPLTQGLLHRSSPCCCIEAVRILRPVVAEWFLIFCKTT